VTIDFPFGKISKPVNPFNVIDFPELCAPTTHKVDGSEKSLFLYRFSM
jgi:hypothetical protein